MVFDTKKSLITVAKYGQESYEEFHKIIGVIELLKKRKQGVNSSPKGLIQ